VWCLACGKNETDQILSHVSVALLVNFDVSYWRICGSNVSRNEGDHSLSHLEGDSRRACSR
jgi:hypothetical protein